MLSLVLHSGFSRSDFLLPWAISCIFTTDLPFNCYWLSPFWISYFFLSDCDSCFICCWGYLSRACLFICLSPISYTFIHFIHSCIKMFDCCPILWLAAPHITYVFLYNSEKQIFYTVTWASMLFLFLSKLAEATCANKKLFPDLWNVEINLYPLRLLH